MAKFKVNAETVSVFSIKENKSVYLKQNETHDSDDFDVNHLHALASNGVKGIDKKSGKEKVIYKSSISWVDKAPAVRDESVEKQDAKESKDSKKK